jgi:hypothetical protein
LELLCNLDEAFSAMSPGLKTVYSILKCTSELIIAIEEARSNLRRKSPERPVFLDLCPENDNYKWEILRETIELLEVIALIINDAEGEYYPTLSLASILVRSALHKLDEPEAPYQDSGVENLRFNLLHTVKHYMSDIIHGELCLLACILDPRAKGFVDSCNVNLGFTLADRQLAYEALDRYINLVMTHSSPTSEVIDTTPTESATWNSGMPKRGRKALHTRGRSSMADFLRKESSTNGSQLTRIDASQARSSRIEVYRNALFMDDLQNLQFVSEADEPRQQRTILDWWKERATLFPDIADVAKAVLAVPATSAPSERVFSIAGRVSGRTRASMRPETIQAMVREYENCPLRREKIVFSATASVSPA